MVILVQLELHNFKTFLGHHVIQINEKFTVVAGSNGSGKSNMVDAVAFAMGAKSKDLRVSRIDDLVHISAGKSRFMYVQVTLQMDDGSDHCFKRSVLGSNTQCYINNNGMTFREYEAALMKFNINTKVNNYLVYQDRVASIIMKTPNERTQDFEEMSASVLLKPEYNGLKDQLLRCEEKHQDLGNSKRSLSRDIKNMKHQESQARRYLQLTKENEADQLQLLLFDLYHIRKSMENLQRDEHELTKTIRELNKMKYKKEKELVQLLEDCKNLAEECSATEDVCKPIELEVKKMTDELVKIKAEKEYLTKRVVTCEQSHKSAIRADEIKRSTVQELEKELYVVQREKDKYMKKYSATLGRNVQLSQSQIRDYEKLKLSLSDACATSSHKLLVLEREFAALKDIYDHRNIKLNEASTAINVKRIRRDAVASHVQKLENAVIKTKNDLDAKRADYERTMTKFKDSKHEELNLIQEIDQINDEIRDFDFEADNAMKKKTEVVMKLRKMTSGVYKRLSDLCWPIHSRYNIAVTKVLGAKAEWIIVDKLWTAIECIKYLKANHIAPCTFLPLDGLGEVRLLERLRNIKNPANVKLIYDVIGIVLPEIRKAVFHATENTLVCETPEDAVQVAYEFSKRHDCVSLDGCYYKKSGIFSGGSFDLVRKAKIWDLKKIESLTEKKENLSEKLREVLKTAPKQSDLSLMAMDVKSVEFYSRFSLKDLNDARKELSEIEDELKTLEDEKKVIENRVAEAKFNMDRAFAAMRELKSNNDAKESEIFANFCRSLGVRSIQEFEDGKESYERKINEFDQQIDRIKSQLSYEQNRDTKSIFY